MDEDGAVLWSQDYKESSTYFMCSVINNFFMYFNLNTKANSHIVCPVYGHSMAVRHIIFRTNNIEVFGGRSMLSYVLMAAVAHT